MQLDVEATGREHPRELPAYVEAKTVGEHQDATCWGRWRLPLGHSLASGEQILKPAGMFFRPGSVKSTDCRGHRPHVGLAGNRSKSTHHGGISPPAYV